MNEERKYATTTTQLEFHASGFVTKVGGRWTETTLQEFSNIFECSPPDTIGRSATYRARVSKRAISRRRISLERMQRAAVLQ